MNKINNHYLLDNNHQDINQSNKIFGFWIYLMSDCIIFTVLFSSYFVLCQTNEFFFKKLKFNITIVFIETMILLFSSIIYGNAIEQIKKRSKKYLVFLMIITFILGLIFVFIELLEFYHLYKNDIIPQNNAVFSGFFTIIGTHGVHVIAGLIWILVLIYKVVSEEKIEKNKDDLICLGMFWHFLDIIWIFVFSFIYIMGVM